MLVYSSNNLFRVMWVKITTKSSYMKMKSSEVRRQIWELCMVLKDISISLEICFDHYCTRNIYIII